VRRYKLAAMDRLDVLIIGASPAGMACAKECAKRKLSVALVDCKSPESPPSPANTVFEAMAAKTGMPLEEGFVKRQLRGMKIVSPAGRAVRVEARGYILERKKLDAWYIERAEHMGAVVLWESRAERLVVNGGRVEGAVVNGEPMYAAITVLACGVDCELAQQAGLSPMRHPEDLAWAMEAVVRAEGIGEPEYFEYTLGSIAPGWKATCSPMGGDEASIGVYVRGHGSDVTPFFERHLNRFEAEHGDVEVLSVARGADPVATIPREIVSDGLMLCGGVCGQSGIAYGMRAGVLAASAADEALKMGNPPSSSALKSYEARWRREFLWEHLIGRFALESFRKMSDEEIDALAALFHDMDASEMSGHPIRKLLGVGLQVLYKHPSLLFVPLRR